MTTSLSNNESRSLSNNGSRRTHYGPAAAATVVLGGAIALLIALAVPSQAAEAPIGLGTAGAYSVLGGQAVTNTGPSTLDADLGVSPGTAITGFPPGTTAGATHAADAVASQAQSDLVIAYNDAAGRAPNGSVAGDLVGQTLTSGVYNSTGPLALSGTVTLDAQGDPSAVWVFQVASSLITASASTVALINGAQACQVYWQVGSSATLGTNSVFRGTIMALSSISVTTGTTVEGRALARNGQVSLDNNTFITPGCDTDVPTTTTTPDTTTTTTDTDTTTTDTTTTTPDTTTTTTETTTPDTTTTTPDTTTTTGTDTTTTDTTTTGTTTTATSTAATAGTTTTGPSLKRTTETTTSTTLAGSLTESGGGTGGGGNGTDTGPWQPTPESTQPNLAYTGTAAPTGVLIGIGTLLVALGALVMVTHRRRYQNR